MDGSVLGGHEMTIQLLLENGANIVRQIDGGCTALHLAAMYGPNMVVQFLLRMSERQLEKSGWKNGTAMGDHCEQTRRSKTSEKHMWMTRSRVCLLCLSSSSPIKSIIFLSLFAFPEFSYFQIFKIFQL